MQQRMRVGYIHQPRNQLLRWPRTRRRPPHRRVGASCIFLLMTTRSAALSLYRSLLRAGGGFSNYNFRDYALRSVRDKFRENVGLTDAEAITAAMHEGRQQLELVKRQTMVSRLFPQGKHAMEHQ